jgi:DNA-binding response OmpR family regulator
LTAKTPAVLLVEGDLLARHPLAEYLRDCGFKVYEANDGEEAKAALSSNLQIDFVLIDVSTPNAGFALLRWVRDNHPDVERALAGSIEKAVDAAGALCNEGPALAKPYEHRLVLERIKQAAAQRDRNPTDG